jgi:hypothetical protein
VSFKDRQYDMYSSRLDPKTPVLTTTLGETFSTTEQGTEATTTEEAPSESTTRATDATWIEDESDANCAGSFHYPSECNGADCKYVAQWMLDEGKTNLRLHLEAQISTAWWTGFGFSRDGAMVRGVLFRFVKGINLPGQHRCHCRLGLA